MAYGVTADGFNRKPLEVILSEVEAFQRGKLGNDLDVSPEQPLGQINGSLADQFEQLWELAEDTFNSDDPDGAEGAALDNLSSLTGTYRRSETKAVVKGVTINLDAATTLDAGAVASVDGHPEQRYLSKTAVTSVAAGNYTVDFESEFPSTVTVGVGQLNTIAEAESGWNSVTNANEGIPGIPTDSNPTLRSRRTAELSGLGSSTVEAIADDILRAFPDEVRSCRTLENTTMIVDANALPAKSFEVIVDDGGVLDNDAIAQVIWNGKPGGIEIHGTTDTGTAIDKAGNQQIVPFTRPIARDVWIEVDVLKTTGFAGVSACKDAIMARGAAELSPGVSVIALEYRSAPLSVQGVVDVTAIRLGFAASPAGTANLPISVRETAQLDPSRILVNVT